MNIEKFKEGIALLQNTYNKKLTKEQLNNYYENLKDMSDVNFINNIKEHIRTNKWMPTIADIRKEEKKNWSNINLNSSYWYANLRIWCEQNNKPYFDINTGEELPPYKN